MGRKCEVNYLNEIACGKGIGCHDVAQDRNAIASEDNVDRVRLLTEAKRNNPQIVRPLALGGGSNFFKGPGLRQSK